MTDDIALLLDFLGRCEPDVRGHGLTDLNAERMAMIERFIAGHCTDAERRQLSEFLQLHPAWIRWIADRVQLSNELSQSDCPPGPDSAPPDNRISA